MIILYVQLSSSNGGNLTALLSAIKQATEKLAVRLRSNVTVVVMTDRNDSIYLRVEFVQIDQLFIFSAIWKVWLDFDGLSDFDDSALVHPERLSVPLEPIEAFQGSVPAVNFL